MAIKKGVGEQKAKTLFDHVKHLRGEQSPTYYDDLSDVDKKTWNNYMILKVLSMQPELLEGLCVIQRYETLPPSEFYTLCRLVVPRSSGYYKYVKPSNKYAYTEEGLDLLCRYYNESRRNVFAYLSVLTQSDAKEIFKSFGLADSEINALVIAS